mmetsp:Transcript_25683/g.60203  ORF Transcript_25683/g.60203 Transcript_25683/m.60203 type:complete len:264 (+) Transcript_25683:601-1392(+)
MASISSKKTMQARLDLAIVKSSRTIRAPSPTYFCTSSDPMTRMKQASVRLATARAVRVFPVPGGPYSKIPLGGSIPRVTNRSGCKRGVSRTSRSFSLASLAPPTSSYVTSGLSSTVIRLTVGSIFGGRGIWMLYLDRSTPTRMPSSISVGATFSPSPTTNLAICFTLITYLLGTCWALLLDPPFPLPPDPLPLDEFGSVSPVMILVHRATWSGASSDIICLSPTKSHIDGGDNPVSLSLIPIRFLTSVWCFLISSSRFLMAVE